jgi:hypothetical protein
MLRRAVLLYTVKIAEMVGSGRLAKPPAAPAMVFEPLDLHDFLGRHRNFGSDFYSTPDLKGDAVGRGSILKTTRRRRSVRLRPPKPSFN